jgi:hypothetical protein
VTGFSISTIDYAAEEFIVFISDVEEALKLLVKN